MKSTISKVPTAVKKNTFFSHFKGSKRVLWSASRNHR